MGSESTLLSELETLQDEVLRQVTALEERLDSLLADYTRSRGGERTSGPVAPSAAAESAPEGESAPERPAFVRPAPKSPAARAA